MVRMEEAQAPPVVSVLIVSYNCAAALRRCLEACERSKGRETIEVLVVDNGSRDECPSMDSAFPAVTVLRLPRNFGLTKARNIGVRTAKGEYLLFLRPDVELLPDTVPNLVERLQAAPEAAAVAPLMTDDTGRSLSVLRLLPDPAESLRAIRTGRFESEAVPEDASEAIAVDWPGPAVLLVRRAFVRGMNFFDERYGHFGSDLELCTQVRRAGRKTLLLPQCRAIWREGGGTWVPSEAAQRALLLADRASGLVTHSGKHYGSGFGLKLRLMAWAAGQALKALVTARDVSYSFAVLNNLFSGSKIDGTQQVL